MTNWTIANNSNQMDNKVGYQQLLEKVRDFVRNSRTPSPTQITIKQLDGSNQKTTSLTMSNNNYMVSHVNGNAIVYNYSGNPPVIKSTDIPAKLPTGTTAPTESQKATLLYMVPEAARSKVIEAAIIRVIEGATVDLNRYAPLVKAYGHTCNRVQVSVDHPARPLTAEDYNAYALSLAEGVQDRKDILAALD